MRIGNEFTLYEYFFTIFKTYAIILSLKLTQRQKRNDSQHLPNDLQKNNKCDPRVQCSLLLKIMWFTTVDLYYIPEKPRALHYLVPPWRLMKRESGQSYAIYPSPASVKPEYFYLFYTSKLHKVLCLNGHFYSKSLKIHDVQKYIGNIPKLSAGIYNRVG